MNEHIFSVHYYPIQYKTGNKISLIPFGDCHRYTPLCSDERWFDFLDWAKRLKNTYYLGMGDSIENFSSSEVRELAKAQLHYTGRKTIDDILSKQVNDFCNEISFMKGKLIGMVEGNHHGVFSNTGMTTTQKICEIMNCKYLGATAFIRLSFQTGRKRNSKIDLFVNHGKGASQTLGGSLNSVEKMSSIANADICLMGHDHQKSTGWKNKLEIVGNKQDYLHLKHKKILLARTGSFLRGYVDGEVSYVSSRVLAPSDLGVIKIDFDIKRERTKAKYENSNDYMYVDIHVVS